MILVLKTFSRGVSGPIEGVFKSAVSDQYMEVRYCSGMSFCAFVQLHAANMPVESVNSPAVLRARSKFSSLISIRRIQDSE